jgi:hypothetical protein
VTGGQRGRLVEEEQLGPAPRLSQRAPASLELEPDAIQRRTCHSRRCDPSSAWMTPRLPIIVPRSGIATISP